MLDNAKTKKKIHLQIFYFSKGNFANHDSVGQSKINLPT
jgi:hypothetical protein